MEDTVVKVEHCYYCNNEGRTKENPYECKHCGRKYTRVSENLERAPEFKIPTKIIENKEWKNKFIANNTSGNIEPKLKDRYELWSKALLQLLEQFRGNKLKNGQTYYIGAGPGSMVNEWAYEMLEVAYGLNFKTTAPISLADIDEDYEEIKNNYLLIIRITDYKLRENIEKLNYIIPTREAEDLITIFISTMPYPYATNAITYPAFERPILLEKFAY